MPTPIENNTTALYTLRSKARQLPDKTPPVSLQEKTVTPSTTVQEIVPDSGYDGMSKVTIEALKNNKHLVYVEDDEGSQKCEVVETGQIYSTVLSTPGLINGGEGVVETVYGDSVECTIEKSSKYSVTVTFTVPECSVLVTMWGFFRN